MRLLLLFAFLAFLPPAAAEEFHEPFEVDIDNNGIPDFWARRSDPGYPRYNEWRKLSPGDVFRLALELSDGNKFDAVLAAHNILRLHARGGEPQLSRLGPPTRLPVIDARGRPVPGQFTEDYRFGYGSDESLFTNFLEPIHGGTDEGGAWYHMFGTLTAGVGLGQTATDSMIAIERTAYENYTIRDPLEGRMDDIGTEIGAEIR